MSYMKRYLDERLEEIDEKYGWRPGSAQYVFEAVDGDLDRVEELAENDPTMFCIYALEGVIRDYYCFEKDIFKDAE